MKINFYVIAYLTVLFLIISCKQQPQETKLVEAVTQTPEVLDQQSDILDYSFN